jgi:hypothetical protein
VFYQGKEDMVVYHNAQVVPNGYWKGEQALTGSVSGWYKNLAVGRHADGRLELFYIGSDEVVYRKAQRAPASWDWGDDAPMGTGKAKRLVVSTNADGRLEVFWVGTADHLYHQRQVAPDGAWSAQMPVRGFAARDLAVERNSDGRLDLFYTRPGHDLSLPDGLLYHTWQETPGGSFLRGTPALDGRARFIAVRQNADQRLELVYIGTNSHLYHNWQTAPSSGTWHGEEGLDGTNAVGCVDLRQNADGRLEVFYVADKPGFPFPRTGIRHNWQVTPNGTWAGEEELVEDSGEALSVGRNADGRLELFFVGSDSRVHHTWQTAPNSGWVDAAPL